MRCSWPSGLTNVVSPRMVLGSFASVRDRNRRSRVGIPGFVCNMLLMCQHRWEMAHFLAAHRGVGVDRAASAT